MSHERPEFRQPNFDYLSISWVPSPRRMATGSLLMISAISTEKSQVSLLQIFHNLSGRTPIIVLQTAT